MFNSKILKVKAFLIDLIFWIYLIGCLRFLTNQWFGYILRVEFHAIISLLLTLFFLFWKKSLGYRFMIATKPKPKRWFRSTWGWLIVIVLLVTFFVGWQVVEVDLYKFFTNVQNTRGILSGLFSPNFKILIPMLKALAETIYLALLATIFAIPFAFVLSFFAARNLMPKNTAGTSVYILIRTIATFFRSVEPIVWAIIFTVWVGIGPFAGMLALMVHSIAALTKLYSEQIENIDEGPVEAITATGASRLQIWIYAVIPQILSPYLAFTIYRWDINVRMATIVGFVGGGGIGLALMQQQQLLRWHNVGLIIWLIAIVVWLMDMISGKIRSKLLEK